MERRGRSRSIPLRGIRSHDPMRRLKTIVTPSGHNLSEKKEEIIPDIREEGIQGERAYSSSKKSAGKTGTKTRQLHRTSGTPNLGKKSGGERCRKEIMEEDYVSNATGAH